MVTIFLLIWVGVPVIGLGITAGLRDRVVAVFDDVVDEFGDSGGNDTYSECLTNPNTTFEECEQLIGD